MKKIFWLASLSFLFVFCALFGFSDRGLFAQTEEHEAIVRLVLVDVVATDSQGNFVRDLKVEDFEVYENGKRMPISSFELIFFEKRVSRNSPFSS